MDRQKVVWVFLSVRGVVEGGGAAGERGEASTPSSMMVLPRPRAR
jgi:hypothetical protein